MNKKILVLGVLGLVLLCLPGAVRADSGPAPEIYSLVQEGQDIKIRYGYGGSGYDSYLKMNLERVNESGTKMLFQKMTPPEEGMEKTFFACDMWNCNGPDPMTECASHPENCVDCDSDGKPECCGECKWDLSWTWVDPSVAPGSTKYTIAFEDTYDAGADSKSIDVKDTGDSSLCSVGSPGHGGSGSSVFVIMSFLGLAALIAGRRKG